MRRCLLLSFLLMASPLLAQNVVISSSISPIAQDQAPTTIDCWISNVAFLYTQVIDVKDESKITWCVKATGVTQSLSYQYTIKVDTFDYFVLIPTCTLLNTNTVCLGLIPPDIIKILQMNGLHLLTINAHDPLTGLDGALNIQVRPPVCIDSGITYSKGNPLPASIQGALRNQQGSFTFESQIGKLRNEGFRIEWQRVQFGLDLNGLNGYWYMLGWCEGK